MQEYKKVNKLQLKDLEKAAVWQFASDEEERYDETYVKNTELNKVNTNDGSYIVKTEFITADKTIYKGFCYSYHKYDLSYIQPTIIKRSRHITFWFGMCEPEKTDMDRIQNKLSGLSKAIFPIDFQTTVKVDGKILKGTINGVLYLDDNLKVKSYS